MLDAIGMALYWGCLVAAFIAPIVVLFVAASVVDNLSQKRARRRTPPSDTDR